MQKKFNILNEVVAQAAVEEGKKLGLQAEMNECEDGGYEISYASSYTEKEDSEKQYATYDDMAYMMREVGYEMKYMREDVAYMNKALAEHKKGHLPPITDAGKFKAALETLGLGESYEVKKPTVWVDF